MLDFVFILAIFLEIILTALCVKKIVDRIKKITALREKVTLAGNMVLEINKKTKPAIENINKAVSIVTNKNLLKISRILKFTVDIIQIIILFRSLNFSKGIRSINFKNLKKLLLVETSRRILRNIFLKCAN